ncbi:LAQU0S19e01398g1_1 [Lachancea quebecensis]|uniref:LAQU0S19e01398g1_1 n=1 Tax=Lachancea quebecensis TaxID=1654605 RepID=A0A0P1KXJ0_9SACH|nr:LAQU0S19e01398g1_1 [Lachancea quebecensis]
MTNDYIPIDRPKPTQARRKWVITALAAFLTICLCRLAYVTSHSAPPVDQTLACDSVHTISELPVHKIQKLLDDKALYNQTLAKLQNAVRVPTEVYDTVVNPEADAENAAWMPFVELHKQLARDFPAIWANLRVEKVNHYGLLITWEGSNSDLKPAMFAAHMDVVPVERKTWSQWEHEPFSGDLTVDPDFGTLLWGRGSFDDKNMLIGVLQALEYMLTQEPNFKPKRGVVVAVGFDEEIGGYFGAAYLTKVLQERYGHKGMLSIIDEGVVGVKEIENVMIAAPGIGEKGRIDLWFHLNTPGGHSSVPPDHTSIGIAAELISDIESEKFPATFAPQNPLSQYYRCIAKNSNTMEKSLKRDFELSMQDSKANSRIVEYLIETGGKKIEYLLRSTHAVDIIKGGIKANALPETVSFLVDSRIAVDSSVAEVQDVFIKKAMKIAKKYDLGVVFEGEVLLPATQNGNFNITLAGRPLEPAAPSPENEVWSIFAGSIKTFYEEVIFPKTFSESRELVVGPSIMSANTDTAHYWNLTDNIYRYQPGFAMEDTLSTIHSVNEHINFDTVMHVVGFTYGYIHAVDKFEE